MIETTTYTNIDFPEAQLISEDIRLYVRTDPPMLTKGKAFLLDEFVSKSTSYKSSLIACKTTKNNPLFLEIIHGRDENVENIFNRCARKYYMKFLATILLMVPTLTWALIFYFWALVWEQMIKKRFAYFTLTTVIIFTLLGIIAIAVTIILEQWLSKETIYEGNFTWRGKYQRSIDYKFQGKEIHRETSIFVGFVWHNRTTDAQLFPKDEGVNIFEDLPQQRRKLIVDLKKSRVDLNKKYKQFIEVQERINSLEQIRDSQIKKNGEAARELIRRIDALKEKEQGLKKDYTDSKTTFKTMIKNTQATIDDLNDQAIQKWKEESESITKKHNKEINKADILRQLEKIEELEHELSQSIIQNSMLQEQISEMRQLNVAAGDAIKDVSLTRTEDARQRLLIDRQQTITHEQKRVDWNVLLRQITPWVAAIVLGIVFISILNAARGMEKSEIFLWLFGIIIILAVLGAILSMVFSSIRERTQLFERGEK